MSGDVLNSPTFLIWVKHQVLVKEGHRPTSKKDGITAKDCANAAKRSPEIATFQRHISIS